MEKFRIWGVSTLGAVALTLLATSVQADVFDFTITSANGDATGQFTATGGPSSFSVTGVTGTVVPITGPDVAITGLSAYGGANNILFEPAPFVDRAGTAFVAGGLDYNIFENSPGIYGFCVSSVNPTCEGGDADSAPVAQFSLTPAGPSAVPEPATWALMLLGGGMLGGARWFARRRSSSMALSA
jgi:hypothetical protein